MQVLSVLFSFQIKNRSDKLLYHKATEIAFQSYIHINIVCFQKQAVSAPVSTHSHYQFSVSVSPFPPQQITFPLMFAFHSST